jgi:hypothetical protein
VNADFNGIINHLKGFIEALDAIRTSNLEQYTDLPIKARLYVEDIDSFRKVRDVNWADVNDLLDDNGWLDRSEQDVKDLFERILGERLHKKDWGGEINDLYSANILLQGARCDGAFLLKGNGLSTSVMQIGHCGKNGDQILRLSKSPAGLLFIQYVGNISEAVIDDLAIKVRDLSAVRGESVHYCIINGQDTARLMRAYGKA